MVGRRDQHAVRVVNITCYLSSCGIVYSKDVTLDILGVIIIVAVEVEADYTVSTVVENKCIRAVALLDDPCTVKGVDSIVLPATHTCGIVFEGVAIVPRQQMRLRPCECVISVFSRIAETVIFAGCMLIIPNCKIAVKF